jgi:phosphate transport system substrate-binding protein
MVPLATKGGTCFEANPENAYTGDYPLARFLYIYFNKKPNEALPPLMGEFIRFVFSKQGQEIVIKDGFYPLSKALADEELKNVGLAK